MTDFEAVLWFYVLPTTICILWSWWDQLFSGSGCQGDGLLEFISFLPVINFLAALTCVALTIGWAAKSLVRLPTIVKRKSRK